jgi:RNA polymerase sigma-70 factor (ECF subfamily)
MVAIDLKQSITALSPMQPSPRMLMAERTRTARDSDAGPGAASSANLAAPAAPPPAERTLDLLARARAGDRLALDTLCRRYLPRLQRWASGRLPRTARDRFETGDLVQEALIRAIRHIGDFTPRHGGAFEAYLRKTLHNLITDEVRRQRTRPVATALDSQEIDHGPSPFDLSVGRELAERYEAALDGLSPEDREAIILRIEFGSSYEQIAEAMDKPSIEAARMAVTRAVRRLAERMRDEEQPD